MANHKIEEKNFELRSEKVRSIVGQIPSSLIRYGITILGLVLFCLFTVAYFMPYKQIYSGTAILCTNVDIGSRDNGIVVLLKFEGIRPENVDGQTIILETPEGAFIGEMQALSSIRDSFGRQKALCHFSISNLHSIENQTVDFQIIVSSGNLLQKMLGQG